jgi:DNA repair protein RadD
VFTMKPRDYQDYAVNSIIQYFAQGGKGHPVVAMPTGTGKSLVIAEFIRTVYSNWPGQKVLMLTHVKELIEQNYNKLLQLWPTAPAGVYSAGVGRKELQYPITFGGIQSVANVTHLCGHIDLILVDECHLIPSKANTTYRKVIEFLMKVNPNLKVIGLTATPYRVGLGLITDEGGLFDEICCDMTQFEAFNWFFDQGYLATLTPRRTHTIIDVAGIGTQQGDFKQKELQEASDQEYITHAAVSEMVQAAEEENRKHWLIFGTGVEHVNHIVTELQNQGVSSAAVHSKMPSSERDANIKAFLDGDVTALVNNGVLTTGFDAPWVDMIGVLRATKSPGLWIQIMGRGTRPYYAKGYDLSQKQGRLDAIMYSEKPDCLVMDFAGNTKRLGPINDPVLPKAKGKGGGEAPVRECEKCNTMFHASLRHCPKCGQEYPPEIKFKARASNDELILKNKKSTLPEVAVYSVDMLTYRLRSGAIGKPSFIEVNYQCGLRRFKQPLCLEHEGFARKKARDWWRKATGCDDGDLIPVTLADAIQRWGECETPKNLRVWINKKPYPEIMMVDYTGELNELAGKPAIQV